MCDHTTIEVMTTYNAVAHKFAGSSHMPIKSRVQFQLRKKENKT